MVKTIKQTWLYRLAAREWNRMRFQGSGERARLAGWKNRYPGKRCFIFGNGPSLKEQNLEPIRNEVSFVVNWFPVGELFPIINPEFYVTSSYQMFAYGVGLEPKVADPLREAGADCFFPFCCRPLVKPTGQFESGKVFYPLIDYRFSREIDRAGTMQIDPLAGPLDRGCTVIIDVCIPLAVMMGFTEIVLLGCDCDYGPMEGGKRAYFYDATLHTSAAPDTRTLEDEFAPGGPLMKSYAVCRREAELRGVRIVNATRGGRLEVFPRVELDEILC